MTYFEILLCCILIPIAYVLIYIAGKYDILGRLIEMLEEKTERKVDRSLVRRARYTLDDFNTKRMVDDGECPSVVHLMIKEAKDYLDKALED
jgi:hypothetical protein